MCSENAFGVSGLLTRNIFYFHWNLYLHITCFILLYMFYLYIYIDTDIDIDILILYYIWSPNWEINQPLPSSCPFRAVLTILKPGNSTTPLLLSNSDAGLEKWSNPLMVIFGSTGWRTTMYPSISGTLMQVSSPKHLQRLKKTVSVNHPLPSNLEHASLEKLIIFINSCFRQQRAFRDQILSNYPCWSHSFSTQLRNPLCPDFCHFSFPGKLT